MPPAAPRPPCSVPSSPVVGVLQTRIHQPDASGDSGEIGSGDHAHRPCVTVLRTHRPALSVSAGLVVKLSVVPLCKKFQTSAPPSNAQSSPPCKNVYHRSKRKPHCTKPNPSHHYPRHALLLDFRLPVRPSHGLLDLLNGRLCARHGPRGAPHRGRIGSWASLGLGSCMQLGDAFTNQLTIRLAA